MAATTEFRIDVIVDPKKAVAGQKQVAKALDATEKEALDLRKALVQALSTRDTGVSAALGKVNATLLRSERLAVNSQRAVFQIAEDVNDRGIRRVKKGLNDVEKKAKTLGPLLKRVFAGIGVLLVARQFAMFSDELTNVQNRLKLVTSSEAELLATQRELFEIANETRSSFEGVATIFTRLAQSGKELGKSNKQLLNFTRTLNKAIILSGASAVEAKAGLIQLSQGLAAGALRGDELRSVLEQLPAVARIITRDLGITIGQLRKMGEQGLITSELIIGAMERAAAGVDAAFEETIPTISQSFVVLRNKIVESVGAFNEAFGASETLARGILFASQNVEGIAVVLGGLIVLLTARYALTAIPKAVAATKALTAAQLKLNAAFVLGAVGVGLVVKILREQQGLLDDFNRNIAENEADAQFNRVGTQILGTRRELEQLTNAVEEQQKRGFGASDTQVARIEKLNMILGLLTGTLKEQATASSKAQVATAEAAKAEDLRNKVLARQEALLKKIRKPAKELLELQEDLNALLERGTITQKIFNAELAKARPKEPKAKKDPFKDQVKSMRELNEELKIQAENTTTQRQGLLIELELRRKGVKVTKDVRDVISDFIIEQKMFNVELGRQKRVEEAIAKIRKKAVKEEKRIEQLKKEVDVLGQINKKMAELNALRDTEAKLIPQINRDIEELRLRQLDASNELADGFTRAFIRIKQEAADLATVGEAVVNVFADRATDALVEFAQTGRFAFKEFADAVLNDLLRIIARLLVMRALSAVTGGITAPPIPGINPGRAHGGTVQPGQAPMPVNEEGQELFVPNRTTTIVPNPASVPQERPQLSVLIVNVQDESMVGEQIAAGQHDEVIIQRMGENKDRLNQATA